MKEDEQENARLDAVFPCILKIMPTCIFNKKDPIVLGVEVMEGIAKVRWPYHRALDLICSQTGDRSCKACVGCEVRPVQSSTCGTVQHVHS